MRELRHFRNVILGHFEPFWVIFWSFWVMHKSAWPKFKIKKCLSAVLTRWHIFCTPDLLSLFPYFLILTFQSALLIFLLVKSSAFDRKLPFSPVSALGWFADLSALQLCSAWFVAMLFFHLLLGAQHSRYSRSRRAGTISIWWEVPFQRSIYLPVGRLKYF